MDIDEFLDKETSHFQGKAMIINSEPDEPEIAKDENILKRIQALRNKLNKKDLTSVTREFESLRIHYIDITKKQTRENTFLFNELLELNRELIKNISLESQEILKKTQLIKQLIKNAKEFLISNNMEEANRLYLEIKTIYSSIADVFQEEKKKINEEILGFYIMLSRHSEAIAKIKFMKQKTALKNHIHIAYTHLRMNKTDVLKSDFDKILSMFDSLPGGFIEQKAILYQDILKLFSSLYLNDESAKHAGDIGGIEGAHLGHQPASAALKSLEKIGNELNQNQRMHTNSKIQGTGINMSSIGHKEMHYPNETAKARHFADANKTKEENDPFKSLIAFADKNNKEMPKPKTNETSKSTQQRPLPDKITQIKQNNQRADLGRQEGRDTLYKPNNLKPENMHHPENINNQKNIKPENMHHPENINNQKNIKPENMHHPENINNQKNIHNPERKNLEGMGMGAFSDKNILKENHESFQKSQNFQKNSSQMAPLETKKDDASNKTPGRGGFLSNLLKK